MTTHGSPILGGAYTTCCGKTPFELPATDQMTTNSALVTCGFPEIIQPADKNTCTICEKPITIQIFKGTGVCSENCRKDRDNDHEPFQAVNLRIE